ncbi:hypothetical protein [Salinispora arenicola]|uniref:hypothetical protein n=1 Tax=Salinispora arenicola TaxID=168697 RepID=UPI0027DB9D67|nr:hypothetical protein [Salinispora arenicola]
MPRSVLGDGGGNLGDRPGVLGGEQARERCRLFVDVGGHAGPWTRHEHSFRCAIPAR